MKREQVHETVRRRYATGSCGTAACHPSRTGYSQAALADVPEALAGSSLGCGSPVDAAQLRPGETVLDLGSRAGLDLVLASRAVGPGGRALGVDMTGEMIERARRHVRELGLTNVEVRPGTIEALPLESDSVDVVISNCVVNLSPDKRRVYREAHRVLRPGGRLVISDLVAEAPMPDSLREDAESWTSCYSGAETASALRAILEEAGFEAISFEAAETPFADSPREETATPTESGCCGNPGCREGSDCCAEGTTAVADATAVAEAPRVHSATIRARKRG